MKQRVVIVTCAVVFGALLALQGLHKTEARVDQGPMLVAALDGPSSPSSPSSKASGPRLPSGPSTGLSEPQPPSSPLSPSPDVPPEDLTSRKKLPDLVPANPLQNRSFCNLTGSKPRKLEIYVLNRGVVGAPPSQTSITFYLPSSTETVTLETPSIKPGETVQAGSVTIPAACLKAECRFAITVDAAGDVYEQSEGNNSVQGVCSATAVLR